MAHDVHLEEFRALRADLERAVLPLAHSIDGRTFEWQAPVHDLRVEPGSYVVLERDGEPPLLGQVLDVGLRSVNATEVAFHGETDVRTTVAIRVAQGTGALIDGGAGPFSDAMARPATPAEVAERLGDARHGDRGITVGELSLAPGVPCVIDAGGFGRHTFLCGQSGSGKTYSLGVMLERLLAETALRIIVLDPNSDYVRLSDVRAGADPADVARHRAVSDRIAVRTATTPGPARLHLAFGELSPEARAALLRLDPIADREEYAALAELLAAEPPPVLEDLERSGSPDGRRLLQRAANLGVDRLGVWSRGDAGSVLGDLADARLRSLVVDLGSLSTPVEQALVAEAVLGALWERRAQRVPTLIVIDEAHNVCPAESSDPLTALAAEHVVRIAAEGRKFGLFLLVSTQRPQKVPENVTSQCDNLVLMRLNSRADAAFAQEVFSFVPAGLLGRASSFRLGEALVAGKVAPDPALLRFRSRVSEEGGGDVPSDWARAAT